MESPAPATQLLREQSPPSLVRTRRAQRKHQPQITEQGHLGRAHRPCVLGRGWAVWALAVLWLFQACPPLGVSYLGWPSVPAHADGGWTRRQQSSALAAAEYTRGRDRAGLGGGSSQVFPPLWGLRDSAGTGWPSLCSEAACWSRVGWRCPPHTPARHAG